MKPRLNRAFHTMIQIALLLSVAGIRAYPSDAAICEKLGPAELADFNSLVRGDTALASSMRQLSELALVLKLDNTYDGKERITLESFVTKETGIQLGWLENFARALVGSCTLIRDGGSPSSQLDKRRTPELYRKAQALCGPPDPQRSWISLDGTTPQPDFHGWVSAKNRIRDPDTGALTAPDRAAGLCTGFTGRKNIEDVIENLFVCLDAFQLSLYEYDHQKESYIFDTRTGEPKRKQPSGEFAACVQSYLKPSGTSSTPGGKSEGVKTETRSRCLPADVGDGACKKNECVRRFADAANARGALLPSMLSSNDLFKAYHEERDAYLYATTKTQARALGRAFVLAAFQRHWDSPQAYNGNLNGFLASCSNLSLRGELGRMAELGPFNENIQDRSYDPLFVQQREMSGSKGQRMVEAVKQIQALRSLVGLLNHDLGSEEVSTLNVPHAASYVPVLKYLADAPVLIRFGKHAQYQCNMFSTMMSHDLVPKTSKLITDADRGIRRLLGDGKFKATAFCGATDESCQAPPAFERYLKETDPERYVKMDAYEARGGDTSLNMFQIRLRDWCSMRSDAAQALTALELQVVAMNPALAHAWKDADGKPGAPLFDRLALATNLNDEEKARLAAQEADQALGPMQEGLARYLRRLCDDLDGRRPESTYMAVLDRHFLGDFDYCTDVTPGDALERRFGLPCRERAEFLGCRLRKEAERWQHKKQLPGAIFEAVSFGIDSAFAYSIISGAVGAVFTRAGILGGGAAGLGFAYGNYRVSKSLAEHNEAQWVDYNSGRAGAVLEGVNSYVDALSALAAAQPKARASDFIIGFVIGAALSGKSELPANRVPRELANGLAKSLVHDSSGAQAKVFLLEQAKNDPSLLGRLLKNMERALGSPALSAGIAKVTEAGTSIRRAISETLNRRGRAQAEEVRRILDEKAGENVADWEADVIQRMKSRRAYPTLEELLAVMAARSPSFRQGLLEFQQAQGLMRWRVLTHFLEYVPGVNPKVTYGRRFWRLWQKRIHVPRKGYMSAADFAHFTVELSNAMFRTAHREPNFALTWLRAFGQVRAEPATWNVLRAFAEKFQDGYRARHRARVEGVALEAFGKPRPEVLYEFYRWGIGDTAYRRLSAVIRERRLGAAFDKDAIYQAEAEKLALELAFVVRPVVSGLFLYWTAADAYEGYEIKKRQDELEDDIRNHPRKYLGDYSRIDADQLQNLTEQLDYLAIVRAELKADLGKNPSPIEAANLKASLARIDAKFGRIERLKAALSRGILAK
ncbi:MAG: hypothetical protein HY074_18765 [Deltaproteobacteria bacterium]|nr:hypothetical protein [Deltaproteobacteria bacterium]